MAKLPANFDWRSSPKHIWFLERFRNPNNGKYSGVDYMIKEGARPAIERFLRDGALAECDLVEKVAHQFKVPELKAILRRHDETCSGSKAELVELAVRVAQEELTQATRTLTLYKRTPLGTAVVEDFKVKTQEAEARAKSESHAQLLAGDAKAAVAGFVAFQRATFDPDYSGQGWQVETLRFLLAAMPKVIGELDETSWRKLQAAAAMKLLWREHGETSWLPDDFKTQIDDNDRAIRLISTAAEFQKSVSSHAEWCQEVKLVFNQDDVDLCEHCGALDGKIFKIKQIPEVPTEHCTSRDGCACNVESVGFGHEEGDSNITVTIDGESGEVLDETTDDPVSKLRQLKQMLDEGLIEKEEYDEKKKEILARM
jgi:hypothetical protein